MAEITDGDTFVTATGERVRLIGIDAPESTSVRLGSVECFGADASRHLAELMPPGSSVRLEFDVERLDRYGRTLAYVYVTADGLFVNRAMVADGFAQPATYPPNVAHADDFAEAAGEARAARLGLWGDACPHQRATPSQQQDEDGDCDDAYPGVCIPPPPPDLDCSDIAERRFAVREPDPHNFDSDGNRVGCER